MNGYIKLHRKIKDWEWYKDPITKAVFLELLLRANYHESRYEGIELKPGQAIYGRTELADCLGITEQNVRTSIKRLKSTKELTTKSTNKLTLVTIANWAVYQLDGDELTNKSTNNLTNNQPTTNQQLTTSKKLRSKEVKNIIQRESKEKDSAFYLRQNHEAFKAIKDALMKGEA